MKLQKKLSIAILTSLGLSMGALSMPAQALQEGDMFMRFTATNVDPDDDNGAFSDVAVTPEVDDDTQPGVTFVYMLKDNIGLEVLAALPFEHDIKVDGMGKIGSTKHLPPTFSVQYYFNHQQKVRPYVGAGINYTTFFDEESIDALGGDLSIDDSFGFAVQAGIDFDINEKWFLTADIRYIQIETEAENSAAGEADVDINPMVMSVGAGFKF